MDQTVIATFKAYYLSRVMRIMMEIVNRAQATSADPRDAGQRFLEGIRYSTFYW
ncbi:unnamed protein product, partial [Trichogramma brassicae]